MKPICRWCDTHIHSAKDTANHGAFHDECYAAWLMTLHEELKTTLLDRRAVHQRHGWSRREREEVLAMTACGGR